MHKLLLSAALAGVLSASGTAQAHDAKADAQHDKCYGIAKAGKNDCASADGKHACAGLAKADNASSDWAFVPKGECETEGGSLKPKKA